MRTLHTTVMVMLEDDKPAAGSVRSRTVLVSFLGSIARRMGNWIPIAGTVELMSQAGLDDASVRTAVFRLKKRGWLASESRGGFRGYALTGLALETLAAGDEVIWHARKPADLSDGWCVVNFSIPESQRAKRYQLRAHLSSLGFGNVGTAMWIAPARMQSAAEQAIAELKLDSYASLFVGDYVGRRDLRTLIYESWEMEEIDQRYRDFVTRYREDAAALERMTSIDPQWAFVTYLGVVDSWRKIPFRDPGLPKEVLDPKWSGPEAVQVFEKIVAALEGRALAHAAQQWPGAPAS
jgi:phenylacetic acid degradation operon negative regulatory protein